MEYRKIALTSYRKYAILVVGSKRVRHRSVNYRMLYFFHNQMAVVSHGLTKENIVPDRDIDLAISRSAQFKHDPERHTYKEQTDG